MIDAPRVLLMIPEHPFDPTSGAARSMRTIMELLAATGFECRAIGSTATERPTGWPTELFAQLGIIAQSSILGECAAWKFTHRGILYRLVDTPLKTTRTWRSRFTENALDQLLRRELRDFEPDILFVFGGWPTDIERYKVAIRNKVSVVFGLRNYGYYRMRGFFSRFSGVLTSSRFLTDFYRQELGIESTVLPLPIQAADVIPPHRQPKFFTAVNPTPEKGQMILARVFGEIARRRPDIPLQVIESQATAGELAIAAESIGYDLSQASYETKTWRAKPSQIFEDTRVLLAPSVWDEPAGRVVAESIANGIPAIVTDRGGLAETANGGAFVIPLSLKVRPDTAEPVDLSIAAPWIALIIRLQDDADFYAEACERARKAAQRYDPIGLANQYAEFFFDVARKARKV